MKVAVLGLGYMGRNHLRVWGEMPDATVVGGCDTSAEACAAVAGSGIPTFTSLETMLDTIRPDVLSVVTPASTHEHAVSAAVARGIHVLVEKPLGPDRATAERIAAAITAAGVVGMVGHIERFNPVFDELRRRVRGGEIGRVFQMSVRRLGPFPPRIFDVGVARDLAVHELDKLRFVLADEVAMVFAQTSRRLHAACEDMINIVGNMSGGPLHLLEVNWLSPHKVRETVVLGEGGMFIADSLTQKLTLHDNPWYGASWEEGAKRIADQLQGVDVGGVREVPVVRAEPLRREIEHFAEAVRTGSPTTVVTLADGVEALRLADATLASALLAEPVRVGAVPSSAHLPRSA